MPELKMKALKEWKRFLALVIVVMLVISVAGFWKIASYAQHGQRDYATMMAWLKTSVTVVLIFLHITLKSAIDYLEERERQS